MPLDLSADVVEIATALVDIPSESHHEQEIADLVEAALGGAATYRSIARETRSSLRRGALHRASSSRDTSIPSRRRATCRTGSTVDGCMDSARVT